MPVFDRFCLIADGEFLPRDDILQLSNHKTIIALDGAYHQLAAMNIQPDIILGDLDSIKHDAIPDNLTCIHTPDQNHTDLEKGIDYAITQGAKQIDIVCALEIGRAHV